jgi:ceramide glucosyltransferase
MLPWCDFCKPCPGEWPVQLVHFTLLMVLSILTLGGIGYYLIAIKAVRTLERNRKAMAAPLISLPSLSLLKPMCGIEPALEANLRTFFKQDYPRFEILFAFKEATDPALPLVEKLMAEYPHIPCTLVVTGASPYVNAKMYSLEKMADLAKHPFFVITDSDVSVAPDYLKSVTAGLGFNNVGALTHLYRGVGVPDFWSKLEALGMSTEFMAGVAVAERLEGMKFILGPSMAISAECLHHIGGFAAFSDYLADDFMLGNKAHQAGYQVVLSTHVVEHHAYSTGFVNSFLHRLRWNRSSRFSRPAGYFGQGFTYGIVWAFLLCIAAPGPWSLALLILCLVFRLLLAWNLGARLLQDPAIPRLVGWVPLQDLLSFSTWLGGFLGREIVWRGQRYRLMEGGRFAPLG